ncbi:hypothetical protein SPRG_07661 [Saprolegnia parasitica CBS 223.65]|uniref:SMP-30/Gluconolactonase/LRE-like region domain-containing protein n=1 Tax=Saprolegnia parasitica (strain CBS 223.65) TaxID=695850 RepID=A0A067C8V0_SAPPC|nr:hypothetical protein SPRG_07661 [Saprolegnia parasitica CBS 223.65]KDO26948.1 hypothetical protein SPRG_07661 [Saprolegnia parasitica CBS 223.65]|eukprot:XP_012202329.1 hypothetical protein SPRG_07661 [Saprolegnia parasitica CBS 223.65]
MAGSPSLPCGEEDLAKNASCVSMSHVPVATETPPEGGDIPVLGAEEVPSVPAVEGEDKKKTKIPPIVFVPLLGAFVVITVVPSVVSNLMNKSSSSPTPAPPSPTTAPGYGGSGTKGWDFTPAPANPTPTASTPTYAISTEFVSLYAQANITGVALGSLQPSPWVALNRTTVFSSQSSLLASSVSHFSGVTSDASGNLFVSDMMQPQIVQRPWNATTSSTYVVLTNATSGLLQPRGLAVCAGVLFALDSGYIKSINKTTVMTVVAGLSTTATNLAADSTGSYLYIADTGAHCIRRVALANYALETYAGSCGSGGYVDGPRLSSRWNSPGGVTVDVYGHVYVSDTGNHVVRKVDSASSTTSTIAGTPGVSGLRDSNGTLVNSLLNAPLGLVINATLSWQVLGNDNQMHMVADNEADEDGGMGGDNDVGSDLEIDDIQRSFSPLNLSSYDSVAKLSRAESAEIFSKKFAERSQVKSSMLEEEKLRRLQKEKRRQVNIQKWQSKLAKSPFKVNLVADNERLDEENRVRLAEEARRVRALEKKTKQVKNDIILKALQETSDLDALRREKRVIMEEEKRLKALLDLEKTNSHRKMDMLAAQNAEKKRKQEKIEFRMKQRKDQLQTRDEEYKKLLKEKLALE